MVQGLEKIGVGGRFSNCCLYVSSYSRYPHNSVSTFLNQTYPGFARDSSRQPTFAKLPKITNSYTMDLDAKL